MEQVACRLLGRKEFSVFVGVGELSARGLLRGMDGIVPGSANVDPRRWRGMCDAGFRGDQPEAERLQQEVNGLAQLLQRGRTLGESLAALKVAMGVLGLCGASMLPPLRPLSAAAAETLRADLAALGLS